MSTSPTSVDGTPGFNGLHRDLRTPHGGSCSSCKGDGQRHWLLCPRGSYCGEAFFCRHPILAYTSLVHLLSREHLEYRKHYSTRRHVRIGRLSHSFPTYLSRRFKLQQILCHFQTWAEITLLH